VLGENYFEVQIAVKTVKVQINRHALLITLRQIHIVVFGYQSLWKREEDAYKVLVGMLKGKRPIEKPRRRW
jgi:hypothetical protein